MVCCQTCSKKLVLKLLFVCLAVALAYDLCVHHMKPELPCFATARQKAAIVFLVTQFDQLAKQHELKVFPQFGTLLGSYKFGGIIPWDADADFGYMETDVSVLENSVLPQLNFSSPRPGQIKSFKLQAGKYLVKYDYATGASVTMDLFGYVQVRRQRRTAVTSDHRQPRAAITVKNDDPPGPDDHLLLSRVFTPPDIYHAWFGGRDSAYASVFPLRPRGCPFEHTHLSCPRNPGQVLADAYWLTYHLGLNVPFKAQCYLQPWKLWQIFRAKKQRVACPNT